MNEHYTIPLPPVTKKNSAQVVHTGQKCPVCRRGKNVRLLPSKQYREYEEAALWCLQRNEPIDTPVNVKCLFYMPTQRKVDLTNLLEAADDLLVLAVVLAERDAWRILRDWVISQMAILETEMVAMDEVMLPYMVDDMGRTVYELYQSRQLLIGEGASG